MYADAMATNTKTHYWINTYYGPAVSACGEGGRKPEFASVESYPATTCNNCLDWLDRDGADD
jgi:hypothetical protein